MSLLGWVTFTVVMATVGVVVVVVVGGGGGGGGIAVAGASCRRACTGTFPTAGSIGCVVVVVFLSLPFSLLAFFPKLGVPRHVQRRRSIGRVFTV